MKTIELSTASQSLSAYAEEFSQETIVLTVNGKAVAAVVSLEGVDPESLVLSTNQEFLEIIQNSRNEFKSKKTLSLEDIKKEFIH
ncbi:MULTISPECIES: type II toxin-antitoxin system Phd/YefM family antitoxin [Planktothrix]|uniref:Antitoxin n=1 Tax=Planktothrix mougeotii LEGE 06226 TaxID=1828728 RepID=A0ABR9U6L5_9CYAN|nr:MULTISPECIES: type II toxin-antitoxin system Phd/YefM family antitoxin [Planktothrix]MBD2481222.1 hypothetical protein [Planktothrix sp. FACHB-1365]MBE9142105.1 hypothetical protein [Planktothrix mougeotii LEGE 06226]